MVSTLAHAASRGHQKPFLHRSWVKGLIFASPWIVGFVVFQLYPIIASAYYSLTDFNIFQAPRFIGFHNYQALFADPRFYKSLYNTLYLTVVGVPLGLALALLCALALNVNVRGQPIFRALLYLPTVVPVVAATYLWRWLLNAQYGYVNQVLQALHLGQPLWLQDPIWTKPALIVIGLWGVGTTTIIYLAALQEVPRMYYEAAAIDGASWWQKFWNITWPAISPVTLFQLVIGILGSFQYFTQAYVLAQTSLNTPSGGPEDSMLMYGLYLFQNAFVYLKMGYASAMAWILFAISLAVTWFVLKFSTRWVHYGGE